MASSRLEKRRRRRLVRRSLGMGLVIILSLFYLQCSPARYNVFAPLDLNDRPTFITPWKLQFASTESCYQALHNAGIVYERLPDEIKGVGCGFEDVARLHQSLVVWGSDVTLTCPMLAALALWERHTLQPAAEEIFGSGVERVRHYGTYSCRNVNNQQFGRRSEHATANAVDVAGFVLADGREISVLRDWGFRTPEGRFLDRIHSGACDHFAMVLGPNANEQHRDHFHFDQGEYEGCQ